MVEKKKGGLSDELVSRGETRHFIKHEFGPFQPQTLALLLSLPSHLQSSFSEPPFPFTSTSVVVVRRMAFLVRMLGWPLGAVAIRSDTANSLVKIKKRLNLSVVLRIRVCLGNGVVVGVGCNMSVSSGVWCLYRGALPIS